MSIILSVIMAFFISYAVEIKHEVTGKVKVVHSLVFSCDLVNK